MEKEREREREFVIDERIGGWYSRDVRAKGTGLIYKNEKYPLCRVQSIYPRSDESDVLIIGEHIGLNPLMKAIACIVAVLYISTAEFVHMNIFSHSLFYYEFFFVSKF